MAARDTYFHIGDECIWTGDIVPRKYIVVYNENDNYVGFVYHTEYGLEQSYVRGPVPQQYHKTGKNNLLAAQFIRSMEKN